MSGAFPARPGREHEPFDELAVGWALHALEPEDETRFARHLPDCRRCASTVAETTELMAAMATDLPPAEPSDELRTRLRAAVAGTDQVRRPTVRPPADAAPVDPRTVDPASVDPGGADRGTWDHGVSPAPWEAAALRDLLPPDALPGTTAEPPPQPPVDSGRPALRRVLPVALAAAAVATILGLGVWNVTLTQARDRAESAAAAQDAVVETLLEPGRTVTAALSGDGGPPVATVVVRDSQLHVVTETLPRNDDRRTTYVLWGTGRDTPVDLGTFDVERSGLQLHAVGSGGTGLDDFPGYAISLEPGREAPPVPTEIVASGQVTN
ncbi:anti-sigma factor [Geodermatophilus sp. YIM 151500]|uniref:anti-sigma factor domain-containing protein n=1 Tax=Geodermatophilus sp. YIM 151500 TaxID=2984531 RepID=UPI0021E477B1|nr:anti-sigma factor [Geodermatophilus sp. YIM 151500]MCV2491418.1 anti-sigma factor [Geodermatophilus sp. YIM 151500]